MLMCISLSHSGSEHTHFGLWNTNKICRSSGEGGCLKRWKIREHKMLPVRMFQHADLSSSRLLEPEQLETELLQSMAKPCTYLHYIDDIFIIWEHGISTLNTFIDHFNKFHPSTQFTMHHCSSEINFLDINVSIERGKRWRSAENQDSQDYASHHPRHCKQGIFAG